MKRDIAYRTRFILIEIGKHLPFVICGVVFVSYVENLCSLITCDYLVYESSIILNKSVSWWIGSFFEYNLITVALMFIVGFAVETCLHNKLASTYLLLQLIEKDYFAKVELYKETIYVIVIINVAISGYFAYKGMALLEQRILR